MKLKNIAGIKPFPTEPGEFDIKVGEDGVGEIHFYCRLKNKICSVRIKRGQPDQTAHCHGWDSNFQAPSIEPSIGCDHAPRCGWHGHITNGEIYP